jgi:hypothetical protein
MPIAATADAWNQALVTTWSPSCYLPASEVSCMRYILAWALGVPFSLVLLWYVVAHAGC